jgi:hypothetical protein
MVCSVQVHSLEGLLIHWYSSGLDRGKWPRQKRGGGRGGEGKNGGVWTDLPKFRLLVHDKINT